MSNFEYKQIKSMTYYIFWGIATVAVVSGQVYMGRGYRRMADSVDRIVDGFVLEIEQNFKPDNYFLPMIPAPGNSPYKEPLWIE